MLTDLWEKTGKPDIILLNNKDYRTYLESLASGKRVIDDHLAKAGYCSLKFGKVDIVLSSPEPDKL